MSTKWEEEGRTQWRKEPTRGANGPRQILNLVALLFLGSTAGLLGYSYGHVAPLPLPIPHVAPIELSVSRAAAREEGCNPYHYHGVLLVNTTHGPQNRYLPTSAPDRCAPLDFITAIKSQHTLSFPAPPPASRGTGRMEQLVDLEFARNKTILLLGDSIDRDHLQHWCSFVGGHQEVIWVDHWLSPPYPKGQEEVPADYVHSNTKWKGSKQWPNFEGSRPHFCRVPSLNLVLINMFYYGFREHDDKDLYIWEHYHPPQKIEDRFDSIALPLLANISRAYGNNPVPDLVSITPGLWDLMRMTFADKILLKEATEQGIKDPKILLPLQPWLSDFTGDEISHLEQRFKEVILHVADANWAWRKDGTELPQPKILWRALHHIKANDWLPFHRVQAIDQIGRAVVHDLVRSGRAADAGPAAWLSLISGDASESEGETEREEAVRRGLGSRLEVDRWGSLMLGQECHLVDDAHPKALPGSWLYGQMLITQLKLVVEARGPPPPDSTSASPSS